MKYQLAAIGLSPLLIAQALYVKCTTPRLPEPDGDRSGSAGSGPALSVLILGDSAAAGVGAATQEQALSGRLVGLLGSNFHVRWKLLAQTGHKAKDVLDGLARLSPDVFDVVVTSIGVNDVTHGTAIGPWIDRQRRMIETLRTKFGSRHILLSCVPPMHLFPALPQPLRWYLGLRARRFNLALEKMAAGCRECEFLTINFPLDPSSMAHDGFHPGAPAYGLWSERVAEVISQRLTAEDFQHNP